MPKVAPPTFTHGVKLFFPDFSPDYVQYEYDINRQAMDTGLPVPKVYQLLELEGRQGIVFERNVAMSARGAIVLDWLTAKQEDPHADVANTVMIMRWASVPGDDVSMVERINAVRSAFLCTYQQRYMELRLDARWEHVEQWMILPSPAAPYGPARTHQKSRRGAARARQDRGSNAARTFQCCLLTGG